MSKKLLIGLAPLLVTAAFAVMPVAAQAAAGSPHFYTAETAASIIKEGKKVPVVSFGTLTLKNVKNGTGASVTCHNVIGAIDENPKAAEGEKTGHEGPPGTDVTEAFDPYECSSAACTSAAVGDPLEGTYISVLAEPTPFKSPAEPGGNAQNLDWQAVLTNDTTATSQPRIRNKTLYAKVNVICHVAIGEKETGELEFENLPEISEGSNQPWTGTLHKFPGASYGFLEFDGPSASTGEGSGELHGPPGEETRTGKTEGTLFTAPYSETGIINTKLG